MPVEDSPLSRLRWRCRRGIKEMDILFVRFLDEIFPHLDDNEQAVFSQLLEESDVDIYAWIMARATPENAAYLSIINRLQDIAEHQ